MKSIAPSVKIMIGILILIVALFLTFSSKDVIIAKFFNAFSIIICLYLFKLLSNAKKI